MATKRTTKSSRGVRDSDDVVASDPKETPKRQVPRPRLHVSHGTKPKAPSRSSSAFEPAGPAAEAKPAPPVRARTTRTTSTTSEVFSSSGKLALAIASAAIDKKAINVEIIDLGGKADYADYLVLMSGGSDRHVRSLADGIEDALRKQKMRPISVEGMSSGAWVLIDYGDVVAHVFQESSRALYDIEGLWLDANRLPLPESPAST